MRLAARAYTTGEFVESLDISHFEVNKNRSYRLDLTPCLLGFWNARHTLPSWQVFDSFLEVNYFTAIVVQRLSVEGATGELDR